MKTIKNRVLPAILAVIMTIGMAFATTAPAMAADEGKGEAIPYAGQTVDFIKASGDSFGMFTAQEGTSFVLSGDTVVIHYVPKNTTTYAGFYFGLISDIPNDPDKYPAEFVSVALKDGAFDFTMPKEACGKAVPIAPVKVEGKYGGSSGTWTSAEQYYLAIPAEEYIPADEPGAPEELTVTNNVPMFKVASAVKDGNEITFTMSSGSYDRVFVGHADDAAEADESELIVIDPDTHQFNLNIRGIENPQLLAFRSKNTMKREEITRS
jgi:hypothetical protein